MKITTSDMKPFFQSKAVVEKKEVPRYFSDAMSDAIKQEKKTSQTAEDTFIRTSVPINEAEIDPDEIETQEVTQDQIDELIKKHDISDLFNARHVEGNLYTNLPSEQEKQLYRDLKDMDLISEEVCNLLSNPRFPFKEVKEGMFSSDKTGEVIDIKDKFIDMIRKNLENIKETDETVGFIESYDHEYYSKLSDAYSKLTELLQKVF